MGEGINLSKLCLVAMESELYLIVQCEVTWLLWLGLKTLTLQSLGHNQQWNWLQ